MLSRLFLVQIVGLVAPFSLLSTVFSSDLLAGGHDMFDFLGEI
jgi:hypothetical protein